MEIMTIQKYIHTSPRKLRLVVDMVRKIEPKKALDILMFTPKVAAKDLSSAIKAALANAKQKGLDSEKVVFKKIEVNESMKMRRYRAGTRGRVKPYKRRMAHIKIVLSDESIVQSKKEESRVKSLESSSKVEEAKEKKGETS